MRRADKWSGVQRMVETMYESCRIMTSSWDEVVYEEGASTEVDVRPFLESFSGDIISRADFSSSFEQGKIIFDLQNEYGDLIMKTPQPSDYIPGWRYYIYIMLR